MRSPTTKFVAPQITCRRSLPSSRVTQRIGFFCPGTSSMPTTAATTTPLTCSPTRSMRSTFKPAAVSRSASSCALADGNSTCACSHDNGTRMSALLPERQRDAHVALDQVADLGQVVLRHQRALDSHAEREPGVDGGVDAGGGEHNGMHHPATAPLDPAFAATGATRFGIRLQ